MSRFSARAVTALSIAALLGVAACGPGEEELPPISTPTTPTPASPTTAAATPTPEASPTVDTVRPEIDIPVPKKYPEMANDDLAGATAAARYFLDLYGYAYNTGNLKTLNTISDPECEKCQFVIELIDSQYSQGHWYENFALLHGEATLYYPTEDSPFYLVVMEVLSEKNEHYGADGELLEEGEEVFYPDYMIGVQYQGPSDWKVVGASSGEGEEW